MSVVHMFSNSLTGWFVSETEMCVSWQQRTGKKQILGKLELSSLVL